MVENFWRGFLGWKGPEKKSELGDLIASSFSEGEGKNDLVEVDPFAKRLQQELENQPHNPMLFNRLLIEAWDPNFSRKGIILTDGRKNLAFQMF